MPYALRYAFGLLGGLGLMCAIVWGIAAVLQPEPVEAQNSDPELVTFSDQQQATDAILARLSSQVHVANDLVVITRDGEQEMHALPKSAQWRASCDKTGLWLMFGPQGDPVQLPITEAALDHDACVISLPELGRQVNALLGG